MQRRAGFTLVELLVAMALIVFMMVILSEAFSVGLESFRRLKAIGDMNSRMRIAAIVMRADLGSDFFEGRKRLSDPNFFTNGPPTQGFFRISHGSDLDPSVNPRTIRDAGGDGIFATQATDHILHFTSKKRGNVRKDFFMAKVPPTSSLLSLGQGSARYQDTPDIFTSQWAEVAYFLRRNNSFTGSDPGLPSTPLYALYRRQRLLIPNEYDVNRGPNPVPATQANVDSYREISGNPQGPNFYFNGPMDVTFPQRRFAMSLAENGGRPVVRPGYPGLTDPDVTANANTWTFPTMAEEYAPLAGADLLLPDVLSFEVLVLLENGSDFVSLYDPTVTAFSNGNPQFQGNGPRVFDTWSGFKDDQYDYTQWNVRGAETSLPLFVNSGGVVQIRIVAVKIVLRVWDVKTLQTRQVSFIQDL